MAQRRSDDHLALRSMSGSPSPGTTICSPNISSPSSSSSSSSSASSVSILQKKTEPRSVNSAKNMVASSNLETSASGLKKRDSNHFLKSSALYPDDYEDMLDKDENHSREASREREREKEKTEREKELREREIKEREREREREKERDTSKKGGKKERENEEPIKETENRPVTELSDKIDPQDRQSKEKGIEMGFDSIPLTSFQDDGRPMSESQQELGKLGQDSTPNQGEEEKTRGREKQNQAESFLISKLVMNLLVKLLWNFMQIKYPKPQKTSELFALEKKVKEGVENLYTLKVPLFIELLRTL